MHWNTIAACVLIFLGAVVMLKSVIDYKGLIGTIQQSTEGFSKRTHALIRTHMFFKVFFFLSYLGVIYLFIRQIDVLNDFFIGLIFFFGAIFVYVGIIIQRKTFNMLTQTNQNLKLYAEKLERNQAKLIRLNKNLENEIQEKEKAKKSDQLKSDFLSQVSHELRTPLTSIFGFAKLIKRDFETICGGWCDSGLARQQTETDRNKHLNHIH